MNKTSTQLDSRGLVMLQAILGERVFIRSRAYGGDVFRVEPESLAQSHNRAFWTLRGSKGFYRSVEEAQIGIAYSFAS